VPVAALLDDIRLWTEFGVDTEDRSGNHMMVKAGCKFGCWDSGDLVAIRNFK
jgi:hypothetical protein